jgi:hypothetical protein
MKNMDKSSKFFKTSRDIVSEFLQTTVVADDFAQYHEQLGRIERLPGRSKVKGRESGEKPVPVSETVKTEEAHVLRADLIIRGFAEKGIMCSVLEPNESMDYKNILINLASKADVLILDWELKKGDEGGLAVEVLKDTIGKSNRFPEQLRLIIIYTGEPELQKVSEKLLKEFDKDIVRVDDYALVLGSTRIAIYMKPNVSITAELASRKIEYERLVDTVIDEFTEMTAGLVANTVIKTLSAIRQNTYKLLKSFYREFDPPFLTHRVLSPIKEDAEQYLIDLILDDLHAILDEAKVKEIAGYQSIIEWLSINGIQQLDFELKGHSFTIDSNEKALALLSDGINGLFDAGISKPSQEGIIREFDNLAHTINFTQMFGKCDEQSASNLNMMFANKSCTRTYFSETTPGLKLGTILKNIENGKPEYLICIQPLCDSVRLEKERAFPFLPLRIIQRDNDGFDIVVKNNGEYLKLKCNIKPHYLIMIRFSPNDNKKVVYAAKDGSGIYWFTDVSKEQKKYSWEGELSWAHSQRLANLFGGNLSRVGLDESEWLRRWATK